jgi:hypothetical protein
MWNPCLTAEIRVDVANGGDAFSGNGLRYNHTTLPPVSTIAAANVTTIRDLLCHYC